MRVTPIAEILKMKKDDPLDAVSGIVTAVYERKTGIGDFGPWAMQPFVIGDGEKTIKVLLRNSAEVVQEGKGHKIYILAGIGKNGKPCGLKVGTDTYQGKNDAAPKTSTIIVANQNATVTFEEPDYLASAEQSEPATHSHPAPAAPAVPPVAAPPPLVQTPLPAPPPAAAAPAKPAGPRDTRAAWAQVDAGLNKLRRLRLRTLAAAFRIAQDIADSGQSVSADHVEKIDSWLAIECCRNGLLAHVPDCDPPNVAGE